MKIVLKRDDQTAERTYGAFLLEDGTRICFTLELPWLANRPNVSCVPAGTYDVKWLYSPIHGRFLYHLVNVPGRGNVEIHIGNSVIDTLGCILCGASRDRMLCKDQVTRDAVLGSHGAFDAFNAAAGAPAGFTLEVIDP